MTLLFHWFYLYLTYFYSFFKQFVLADTLVIIPTYNEKENITAIINAVLDLGDDFNVLVVDDGSPDGTAQIVKNLMSQYPDQLL